MLLDGHAVSTGQHVFPWINEIIVKYAHCLRSRWDEHRDTRDMDAMDPKSITPITVRRYGHTGPQVVLLHGGPGAPGEMVPVAQQLKDRFKIMEPLQRASGETPLTVERHVLDLHEMLEESLKEGPVRVVGFSWGAMLGLTYAARFPEGLYSLILIGCGTFDVSSRTAYQDNMLRRMSPEMKTRINSINDQLSIEKNRKNRNRIFTEFGNVYTGLQSYDALPPVSEEVLECDEAGFRETWEDAMILQQKGIQPAEFKKIQAPVTMIHGKEDPHPGSMIYASLHPFIQNLTYKAIPQCGHKPWIERMARNYFFDILMESLR